MTTKLVLRELSRYPIGTFADIIYRNALLFPDSEAFVYDTQPISFSEFNHRVNRLIHGLQALGIKKGDNIGILSWNRIEYCEVFGAAMKGGFVLSHFNPRLQAEELIQVFNDSQARLMFFSDEFVEIIDAIRERLSPTKMFSVFGNEIEPLRAYKSLLKNRSVGEPDTTVNTDDPLVIFYTSGTTGVPRGAIYTH